MSETKAVLQVQDLEVSFKTERGTFPFLDAVNLTVQEGEVLGIVGESGSGKSITCLSLMGLLQRNGFISKGQALFEDLRLDQLSEKEMDRIRGKAMTMIFQDAMGSLNPVFTIENQLCESMKIHLGLRKKEARARALELLAQVGLPNPREILKAYPYMLSGGMQQRVMIAMALACDPKLLIADEPTTALDVTVQAQIMQILSNLVRERQMSLILITHDIGLIAEMADRVLVMYAGQVLEETDVFSLFEQPAHPYTQLLLASVPSIEDDPNQALLSIRGSVPEHYNQLTGCRFANRCPYAEAKCSEPQILQEVRAARVRCWKSAIGQIPRQSREEVLRHVE